MSSTCLSRRSDMMMMMVAPWKRGFLAVINSRFFSPVFTSLVKKFDRYRQTRNQKK